jgi:hypothetical protein
MLAKKKNPPKKEDRHEGRPCCRPDDGRTKQREHHRVDLGDRWSRYCVIDSKGAVVKEDRVRTSPEALVVWQNLVPI